VLEEILNKLSNVVEETTDDDDDDDDINVFDISEVWMYSHVAVT
jgi:hypothetical protein